MTRPAALAFLVFNLLCAPCFAAIGAIRREMNSARWTCFAIGYQTLLAYATSLVIYNLGSLFSGTVNALTVVGSVASVAVIALAVYLLARPCKVGERLEIK